MIKKLLNITALLLLAATAAGQEPLRDDVVYDSLVNRRTAMSARESAAESLLEAARKRFAAADENERTSMQTEIIGLEMSLFGLRDSLDAVSVEIGELERKLAVENIGKTTPKPAESAIISEQNPNIVYNRVFRETLPADYYRQLIGSQEKEQQVDGLISRLGEKYSELEAVASIYMIADKIQVDSLFASLIALADSAWLVADSMAAVWNDIYDTKIYLYNWLLSNRNPDLLPAVERQAQNVRRRLAEVAKEDCMYPELAVYSFEKELVTHYEISIASREGLRSAEDSLRRVSAELLTDDYLLPVIDLEERVFLDLADIAVSQRPKYGTNNPIPKTEIHPKGTIYRILLGSYSKSQPVSIFRGVYPLSVERRDGKYHYFAGGFATAEEAEEAAVRAKKYGLTNPRVVAWVDGEYIYNEDYIAITTPGRTPARYRVEIAGADDGLSELIREVIAINAKGKEISRVVNTESGEVIFTVGSFDDAKAAQKLADAINSADGTAVANMIKL